MASVTPAAPTMVVRDEVDYDIAVPAVNEAATIERCLLSINRASAGSRARIAVLLNGTTDHSLDIIRSIKLENAALSVYRFPAADKANAINRFLYDLRLDARTYVFVDAYAKIGPEALRAMTAALGANPNALIATGVPTSGRSAEAARAKTLQGGVVNGQLYAMTPEFVNRFVAAGLRLPVQLYRGDGLLGSMAAHDLDAAVTKWDSTRIVGVAEASFEISPLSILKWRDIRRQYRREIRQARGRLENEAIKSIIYADGYAALPGNANDMVVRWLKSHRPEPKSLQERYFIRLALRQLDAARPAPGDLVPELLLERR